MEQKEILDQKNESPDSKKRPTAITVICVIGFIGVAFRFIGAALTFTIPMIFSDIAGQIESWYPPYLGLSAVLGLVCMIGLWKMKKWAAYTYTGFVVLNQVFVLTMGIWSIMTIIIQGIILAIAFTHVNKMD